MVVYRWWSDNNADVCTAGDQAILFLEHGASDSQTRFFSAYWTVEPFRGCHYREFEEFAQEYLRGSLKLVPGGDDKFCFRFVLYDGTHLNIDADPVPEVQLPEVQRNPITAHCSCMSGDIVFDQTNPAFLDRTVIGLSSKYRQAGTIVDLLKATRRLDNEAEFLEALERRLEAYPTFPQQKAQQV